MTECPLTRLPIVNFKETEEELQYKIKIEDKDWEQEMRLCKTCLEQAPDFAIQNGAILRGLLLNRQWNIPPDTLLRWQEQGSEKTRSYDLHQLLAEGNYPRTPREKIDNLFLGLYKRQSWDGARIPTFNDQQPESYGLYYLENYGEYTFYLKALTQQGLLLEINFNEGYQLSYAGLNRVIELQESGEKSNRCFIAMSFTDEEKINQIRSAIKSACIETGFRPILIDEVHFDSDVTINDAMIAEIKRCKFCIADFTQQKDGVYFESGFASGRGLKVIYTCHRDDRKGRHFDVRAFPFLYYEDMATLKSGLINKINAWIKD